MKKTISILFSIMLLSAYILEAQQFESQVDKNFHNLNGPNAIVEVHYDSTHKSGVGAPNSDFIVAARLTPAKLIPYIGNLIKSINVFIQAAPVGSVGTVKIYGDGTSTTPGTLLYTSVSTHVDSNAWNLIPLSTPITITGTDLWIGFEATATAYPFWGGCDAGPNDPDGQWIFFNNAWAKLSALGATLTYNWNIRAEVDNATPVELTSFVANSSMGKVSLNWRTATEINNRGFEIQRKADDNNWIVIAFKNGNGTTTSTNNYSFTDDVSGLNVNKLSYRLRQVDFNGQSQFSPVVLVDNIVPVNYSIAQNFPNPFNPTTMIKYQLPENSFVSIKVYNSLGQEATTLVNGMVNAGTYEVQFNASNLPSGVYYYKIKAGDNFVQTKKMILMK